LQITAARFELSLSRDGFREWRLLMVTDWEDAGWDINDLESVALGTLSNDAFIELLERQLRRVAIERVVVNQNQREDMIVNLSGRLLVNC
jgi:hypothetical protein